MVRKQFKYDGYSMPVGSGLRNNTIEDRRFKVRTNVYCKDLVLLLIVD